MPWVNPEGTALDEVGDLVLRGKAAEVLPLLFFRSPEGRN